MILPQHRRGCYGHGQPELSGICVCKSNSACPFDLNIPCKPGWRHPEAGREFSNSQHRPHLQWRVTAGQLNSSHQDHKARYAQRGPFRGACLDNRKTRTMLMKPYHTRCRRSNTDIVTKIEVTDRALAATAGQGINTYPIEVLP